MCLYSNGALVCYLIEGASTYLYSYGKSMCLYSNGPLVCYLIEYHCVYIFIILWSISVLIFSWSINVLYSYDISER